MTTPRRQNVVRDAALTLTAVVMAFLALDDITTDHDASFVVERAALIVCDGWFLFTAWRLRTLGYRRIAFFSAVMATSAAIAHVAIRPGISASRPEYMIALIGLAWFAVVAGLLGSLWTPTRVS